MQDEGVQKRGHHSFLPHNTSIFKSKKSARRHRQLKVGSMCAFSHSLTHCWETPTASASCFWDTPRSRRSIFKFAANFLFTTTDYNYSCKIVDIQVYLYYTWHSDIAEITPRRKQLWQIAECAVGTAKRAPWIGAIIPARICRRHLITLPVCTIRADK